MNLVKSSSFVKDLNFSRIAPLAEEEASLLLPGFRSKESSMTLLPSMPEHEASFDVCSLFLFVPENKPLSFYLFHSIASVSTIEGT